MVSKKTGIVKGINFLLSKDYLFVDQLLEQSEEESMLYVTNSNLLNYEFNPVNLSTSGLRLKEKGYSFLESEKNSVFIHANHFGDFSKYGHVYNSDASGNNYYLSLYNNIINDGVSDFTKIIGLDGIYIANVIDQKWIKDQEHNFQLEEQEKEISMMDSNKNNKVTKKGSTNDSYKDFVQSYITFNKGGKWHFLKPPEVNIEGNSYDCASNKSNNNCNLHLHSASSPHSSVYSAKNSIGIIIGNGNVGKYLNNDVFDEEDISTFLSRDGGFTWFEIRKGSHSYEISDHGALIVLANKNLTNQILYSWDEGLTWKELKVSEDNIIIKNIIVEPKNISQRFIIYGYKVKKGMSIGILISIDFSSLHETQCRNPDNLKLDSDYETWTPNDGRRGHNCLLGKKTTYIRKKREVQCFNGEEFERKTYIQKCECTEEDYECDSGYTRLTPDAPCTYKTKKYIDQDHITNDKGDKLINNPPSNCNGYYNVSRGYRKIAGDECISKDSNDNSVSSVNNYDPILVQCPSSYFTYIHSLFSYLISILVLVAVFIFILYNVNITFLGSMRNRFKNAPITHVDRKNSKNYVDLVNNN